MSLTEVFTRVVKPTTSMSVTITYNADGGLSLYGNGRHGSGQTFEYLTKDTPASGFTKKDCFRLQQTWERWHLNDCRAGTPKQEEAVRKWRSVADDTSYDAACKMLKSINLLVDDGYKYGTSWLKEEVPNDVLEWLFSLPGKGHTFSDIYLSEINDKDFDVILNLIQT